MAKGKYEHWLQPEGLLLLGAWARDGLTDEQIARNIGISRSTLSAWKKSYPDISDALKKGKDVVDIEVENALLQRARGTIITEVVITDSEKDGRKTVTRQTEIPPDVTAAIFWLKNRRPDRWRDKPATASSTLPDIEQDPLSAALKEESERMQNGELP